MNNGTLIWDVVRRYSRPRSNDRDDLQLFVDRLRTLDQQDRVEFLNLVFDHNLMIARGFLGLVIKILKWRGKDSLYIFLSKSPESVINQMWEKTIWHIVSGKDTEDSDSVGGWSQRELNMANRWLWKMESFYGS